MCGFLSLSGVEQQALQPGEKQCIYFLDIQMIIFNVA